MSFEFDVEAFFGFLAKFTSIEMLIRLSFAFFCCVALITCTGCNPTVTADYHKLELGTVTGTVRLEGEPLSNYHIIFQSEKGTFSYGKTDKQGRYSLMFNSQKPGVTKGTKVVRIRKRRFSEAELFPAAEEDEGTVSGDMDSTNGTDIQQESETANSLPDVYHLNSQIRVEVKDTNQVINFDLQKDGSTTGPV